MIRSVLLFVSSLLLICSIASAQPKPGRYDQVIGQVRELSGSPLVRLLQFGHSTDGRAIPAFIISDFSVASEYKSRVFICAGQHGDEYNPVKALMSLCADLTSAKHGDLLKRCVFVIVPIVNPSGVDAQDRLSSDGTDTNRDWLKLSIPETWFVDSVVKQWNPHLLIDLHEWTEPIAGAADSIEVPHSDLNDRMAAMSDIADSAARDAGLTVIHCSEYSNPDLLHRAYAVKGYAAYLIETAYDESYGDKEREYHTAVLRLVEAVAGDKQLRSVLSPGADRFDPRTVQAYLQPVHKPVIVAPPHYGFVVLLGVGYCLIVWLMKPHTTGDRSRWSRKYTRCLVDADLETPTLRPRRKLQPLTAKSWVHRRLRSRYARTGLRKQTRPAPNT